MNWKIATSALCLLALLPLGAAAQAAESGTESARARVAQQNVQLFLNPPRTGLEKTDPELAAMMQKYIYGDIAKQAKLTVREQQLVTLAVLTTGQHEELLARNVRGALHSAVTPLDIRETIYHLAPYIGFPKVLEAMEEVNEVFREEKISLPLPDQGTTTDENRLEKGLAFQVATYGDRINKMRAATPANQKHLQDDLSAFCFGDIYTRKSLDLKTREMITVAAIGTLGNDEPQFKAHVRGYLSAGATQDEVIGVVTVLNPYVGFPRTLNNLRAVNEVFAQK